ncbi:MAG: LPS assembly lipoprotein LptE [Roseibacillus sp.]|nr:LPS assembly lipoprotein LptE [Roseibacillus sp.]
MVHHLNVGLVENDTQIPRAAALATNCLIDAITRDGTYRISRIDTADARLLATLQKVEYRQARSTREDILRSEELEMEVHLHWSLVDARNPAKVLASGTSRGSTRFFVDPNLQTANQTALVDAIKRAAEGVVAHFAEGF